MIKFLRLTTVIGLASAAMFAAETPVQMKALPAAVQKTVQEQTRNAKLHGLAKEVEDGKTFYEAETTVNGKSRDVLIDASGTVVEVEEATDLARIPEAARKALQAKAGSGKVLSVETVTRGSLVSYEGVIQVGGKKSEVAVNADGSPGKED
jgi:uncharacterized membrane protein YkoI